MKTLWIAVPFLSLLVSHATASDTPPTPFHFEPSAIDGGGGTTIVSWDPHHPGRLLVGGDVSGIHRSDDYGQTWTPSNTGLIGRHAMSVASIFHSPERPNVVYMGCGYSGTLASDSDWDGGGLYVSADSGLTWRLLSAEVGFSGKKSGGTFKPLFAPTDVLADSEPWRGVFPRSVGNLLHVDDAHGWIFMGTFQQGLVVGSLDSMSDPTSLTLLRNADGSPKDLLAEKLSAIPYLPACANFVRGLAATPDQETLHVGLVARGAWTIKLSSLTSDTAPVFPSIALGDIWPIGHWTNTPTVEEIVAVGNDLYFAAGEHGLWRKRLGSPAEALDHPDLSVDPSATGLPPIELDDRRPYWCSVAGRRAGTGTALEADYLLAGCTQPAISLTSDDHQAVVLGIHPTDSSLPGGWATDLFDAGSRTEVDYVGGEEWWRSDDRTRKSGSTAGGNVNNTLGRQDCRATHLAWAAGSAQGFAVAGNQAAYLAELSPGPEVEWHVGAKSMQLVVGRSIQRGPAGRIWAGVADWMFLTSAPDMDFTEATEDWDRPSAPGILASKIGVGCAFHQPTGYVDDAIVYAAMTYQLEQGDNKGTNLWRGVRNLDDEPMPGTSTWDADSVILEATALGDAIDPDATVEGRWTIDAIAGYSPAEDDSYVVALAIDQDNAVVTKEVEDEEDEVLVNALSGIWIGRSATPLGDVSWSRVPGSEVLFGTGKPKVSLHQPAGFNRFLALRSSGSGARLWAVLPDAATVLQELTPTYPNNFAGSSSASICLDHSNPTQFFVSHNGDSGSFIQHVAIAASPTSATIGLVATLLDSNATPADTRTSGPIVQLASGNLVAVRNPSVPSVITGPIGVSPGGFVTYPSTVGAPTQSASLIEYCLAGGTVWTGHAVDDRIFRSGAISVVAIADLTEATDDSVEPVVLPPTTIGIVSDANGFLIGTRD